MSILRGADILPGQIVLEIELRYRIFHPTGSPVDWRPGCLVAMDVLPKSIELVSRKVQAAELNNVRVVKGDALDTGLEAEAFHGVLLFGVIPSPMLPSLSPSARNAPRPESGRDAGSMASNPRLVTWIESFNPHYSHLSASGMASTILGGADRLL